MSAGSPIAIPGVGASVQFGTAVLVAGQATVSIAHGPASRVMVTHNNIIGTAAVLEIPTASRINSTDENTPDGSFTVIDPAGTDLSVIDWVVVGY